MASPRSFFSQEWQQADFESIGIKVGDCGAQTFMEVWVLVLAIELWARQAKPFVFLGDNTSALQEAITLRGRDSLAGPSQIIAVLDCRRSLCLQVAHLHNEANTTADALSRLHAPEGNKKNFPSELAGCKRVVAPQASFLRSLIEPPAQRW